MRPLENISNDKASFERKADTVFEGIEAIAEKLFIAGTPVDRCFYMAAMYINEKERRRKELRETGFITRENLSIREVLLKKEGSE